MTDRIAFPFSMSDIEDMTVLEHHTLCLGLLHQCYRYVPHELQLAIVQGVIAAKEMGAPVEPKNLGTRLPLAMNQ